LNDRSAAAAALDEAEQTMQRAGFVPPWHRSAYEVARLQFNVQMLEDHIEGGGRRRQRNRLLRQARISCRRALSVTRAAATHRIEAYRLAGTTFWLSGRHSRAHRLWAQGLAEGQRLGALPELARIHAEIYRRETTERGSNESRQVHYQQARVIFEKLGLEWELARLPLHPVA
jgi:hypothetical protein